MAFHLGFLSSVTNQPPISTPAKSTSMFKNVFQPIMPGTLESEGSYLINIIGLSVEWYAYVSCCMLKWTWVRQVITKMRSHYRVVKDLSMMTHKIPDATTPPAWHMRLRSDLPEVAQATRFFPAWGRKYWFNTGEKVFMKPTCFVSTQFFWCVWFPFVYGDKRMLSKAVVRSFDRDKFQKIFGMRIHWKNSQDQYQQRNRILWLPVY